MPVPHDDEGLSFQVLRVEDTSVVGRGHHDFAVGQHLGRLGAGFPPHDVVLDGIQLAEGPANARVRIQRGVDLVPGHAVGQQGEFEIRMWQTAHAPSPRKLFQVEEIGDGGGLRRPDPRVVVDDDGRVVQVGRTAFRDAVFRQVLRRGRAVGPGRHFIDIDRGEKALVAAQDHVGELHVDHVPVHVAHVDLGPDLRQAAVVVFDPDFYTGFPLEAFDVSLHAGAGVRPAPADQRQRLLLRGGGSGRRPGQRDQGRDQDALQQDAAHGCLSRHSSSPSLSGSRTRQSVGVHPMRIRSPVSRAP